MNHVTIVVADVTVTATEIEAAADVIATNAKPVAVIAGIAAGIEIETADINKASLKRRSRRRKTSVGTSDRTTANVADATKVAARSHVVMTADVAIATIVARVMRSVRLRLYLRRRSLRTLRLRLSHQPLRAAVSTLR